MDTLPSFLSNPVKSTTALFKHLHKSNRAEPDAVLDRTYATEGNTLDSVCDTEQQSLDTLSATQRSQLNRDEPNVDSDRTCATEGPPLDSVCDTDQHSLDTLFAAEVLSTSLQQLEDSQTKPKVLHMVKNLQDMGHADLPLTGSNTEFSEHHKQQFLNQWAI